MNNNITQRLWEEPGLIIVSSLWSPNWQGYSQACAHTHTQPFTPMFSVYILSLQHRVPIFWDIILSVIYYQWLWGLAPTNTFLQRLCKSEQICHCLQKEEWTLFYLFFYYCLIACRGSSRHFCQFKAQMWSWLLVRVAGGAIMSADSHTNNHCVQENNTPTARSWQWSCIPWMQRRPHATVMETVQIPCTMYNTCTWHVVCACTGTTRKL